MPIEFGPEEQTMDERMQIVHDLLVSIGGPWPPSPYPEDWTRLEIEAHRRAGDQGVDLVNLLEAVILQPMDEEERELALRHLQEQWDYVFGTEEAEDRTQLEMALHEIMQDMLEDTLDGDPPPEPLGDLLIHEIAEIARDPEAEPELRQQAQDALDRIQTETQPPVPRRTPPTAPGEELTAFA